MTMWRRWGPRPKRLREGLPLSPNEERYILAESMTGQVYIAPSAMRIRGPVDMDAMEASIQATCDRHEARRTGFEPAPGGGFTKYVLDRAQVRVKRLSMPGATDEQLKDVIRKYIYQKGDFSPETLHRYLFIQMGPQDWVCAHGFHHATSDGVTGNSFLAEMFGRVFGFEVDGPVPQYSDYWDFDWRSSEAYTIARDFWIERLAGLESGGVLPPDRQVAEPAQARPGLSLPIPPEVRDSTRRAAEALGVTHFTFFYAVYLILLSRLTGADRVCTTFQSAGRRGKPGAEAAHGVFSNSLILGVRVDEHESLRTLAGRLRVEIREAIANEIFPYHHVIRATGLHPKFAINWYPQGPTGEVQGVTFEGIDLVENQDDDDLNVRIFTYLDEMSLVAFYDARRFGEARVRAIAEQLVAMAHVLASQPDLPIRELPSRALPTANATAAPVAALPQGASRRIFDAFLDRVQEDPDATAIVSGDHSLSYGELERASRRLAQKLRAAGVRAGDRVAILGERDPRLVCALLAVARAGAAFAVLDAAHPEPYLARLAEAFAPKVVLWAGDERLAGVAQRLAEPLRAAALEAALDAHAEAWREGLDAARAEDLAYCVFTSGSTGKPKAVANSHQALAHFIAWQADTFGLSPEHRFALLSGLSHDPMLRDVFAPLSLGATLAIPDVDVLQPGALADWLRRERVAVVHLTPPMGQLLVAGREMALKDLRWVFWGGDLLRPALARTLAARAPEARQVNFYGCTETPQAAAFHVLGPDLDADGVSVPIGQGAADAELLVLGPEGAPVGGGELGEIAVRSNLLSLGYLESGAIQPPQDRLIDEAGRPAIYPTGDRGYRLPDGAVMVVGRRDDQVKVRGHRLDLAEVIAALQALPQVRSAAVLPVGELGLVRLVAFVAGPRGLDVEAVRASLAARFPAHMVPTEIRRLDFLPLSPNGKVNRAALAAELEATAQPGGAAGVPASRAERALMEAWSEVLSRKVDARAATFASLGGDSLTYVQAYLALEELIGEPPEGWQLMPISELAAHRPASKSLWSAVDTPILVRAASILLVVAGHFGVLVYGGGATSILMLVSGYMLGGLALREAFARQDPAPVLQTVKSILVPTVALSLALWLFRTPGRLPESYILFFTADLQDYSNSHNAQDLYLWFVHCLLHMLVIVWLAVAGLKALGGWGIGLKRFLWIGFGAACVLRFAVPWMLDPGFFVPGHHRDIIYLLPTTHLATIALGGLAATASSGRERARLVAVTVVYALASGWCFGPNQGLFLLAGGLLLTAVPRVTLPSLLSPVALSLAGASLWIYMTHMMVRDGLRRIHLGEPLLGLLLALVIGVGVWFAWRRGLQLASRLLRRPAPLAADPAF